MKKIKILTLAAAVIFTVGALASCKTDSPKTSESPKTTAVAQTEINTQTKEPTKVPTVTPADTSAETPVDTPTAEPSKTPLPTVDGAETEELRSEAWKADKNEHWHVTVSGKKADVGSHDLVEDECTVCGCMIIESDEYVFVSILNENYDEILDVEYENGELTFFIETEYTYDDEMNILTHKSMNFDKPYEEGKYSYATYVDDSFGEVISFTYTYCSELTRYNDDGTKTVKNYDENELLVKSTDFDAEGVVTEEATFEYTFFDDGFVKSIKKFVGGKPAFETIYSSFDEGYMITKQIVYNEDGTTTEYELINPID